jgi:predicted secreted Zn-dependent protease
VSVEFLDPQWTLEPVDGPSLAAVAETISQMLEAGKTEWFPRYTYETDGDDLVSSVAVTVEMQVTLPSWVEYDSSSDPEKTEWDRFCGALRSHEEGHIEIVQSNLSGVDALMVGKSVEDAAQAWANAQTTLQSASNDYDTATDHGRNQGAMIDVTVSASQDSQNRR